jgi:hypothetical protein
LLLALAPHPISLACPLAKVTLHHRLAPIDAGHGSYREPNLLIEGEVHAPPESRGGPSGASGEDVLNFVVHLDLRDRVAVKQKAL